MTAPFRAQGHRTWRWTTADWRQLVDDLRERPLDRRQELEQLAEARHTVVGGHELGEDEAAAHRAGEDDAVAGRGQRQRGERVRACARPRAPCPRRARSTRLVTVVGKARRPRLPSEARRRRKRSSSCSTGTSRAFSSTRKIRSAAGSSDGPEIGADGRDEPLGLAERLGERDRLAGVAPLADVRVRRDRLDVERAEHQREDEGRRREGVVDDDAEAALADRLDVERGEEVLDVALGRAGGVADLPHLVPGGAPELLAREVLLELLHERAASPACRAARRCWICDDLRVVRARPDVDAGVEPLGLQEVAVDRGRHDAAGRPRGRPPR